MYNRSVAFMNAAKSKAEPLVILGLQTVGGIGLHAKHTPTLAQSGFTTGALADGTWLADGTVKAGEGSVALIALRSDAITFGPVGESLSSRPGDLGGLFSSGRDAEIWVTLSNEVGPNAKRYFSWLAASDGIVGAVVDLAVTFTGLTATDVLRRFSGIVERCEISPEAVMLRAKAL